MKRTFFRTLYISLTVLICCFIAAFGIAAAYESTRLIGFGEYRKAIETDGVAVKILDFELLLPYQKSAHEETPKAKNGFGGFEYSVR